MVLIQINMNDEMNEIVRWYCALEKIHNKKDAIRDLIISYGKDRLKGYVKIQEE